jgi:hypothetical protein
VILEFSGIFSIIHPITSWQMDAPPNPSIPHTDWLRNDVSQRGSAPPYYAKQITVIGWVWSAAWKIPDLSAINN